MKTEFLALEADTKIEVTEDIRYIIDFDNLSGDKKYSAHLMFQKEGVEAEIVGLYKLKKDQKVDLTTISHHMVPNTKCTTNVRGVLMDNAYSNYIGKIVIDKPAQQTVSYLDDKVLVVGEASRNASQPILEIEADDVKASHGATTGNVDKSQLYYLQTRGLSREEAESLIIKGFFTSALADVEDATIKEEILEKLGV